MGIHNDKHNNQRVQRPVLLVKSLGRDRINTWRVDVLNLLISPIERPVVLLVVGDQGRVLPHFEKK